MNCSVFFCVVLDNHYVKIINDLVIFFLFKPLNVQLWRMSTTHQRYSWTLGDSISMCLFSVIITLIVCYLIDTKVGLYNQCPLLSRYSLSCNSHISSSASHFYNTFRVVSYFVWNNLRQIFRWIFFSGSHMTSMMMNIIIIIYCY